MVETVVSADGTPIAFDRVGTGRAVIVIGGAFNDRRSPAQLVSLLSEHFTVYSYDRRGRGDSGNTEPYDVKREVEDLGALIDVAGGSAAVYGHSSGAILTLLGAASGLPITRIAVYEPPFTFDPDDASPPTDDVALVHSLLADGDLDGAARAFMRVTGAPQAAIDGMSHAPFWPNLVAMAPTLPHELALSGDGKVPSELLTAITVPVLAIDGGTSPGWAHRAGSSVVAAVSDGHPLTIPGQNHMVDQAVLAPVLIEFFS